MKANTRALLAALREHFFVAWSQGQWQRLTPSLSESATLISSQHGDGRGVVSWQHLLSADLPDLAWLRTSNHATVLGARGQAAGSAYAFGLFSDGQRHLLFGASVILQFQETGDQWLLVHARIQINWYRGEASLVPHWRLPPGDSGWQLGDLPPVIVSELDSPWVLDGAGTWPGSAEEAVIELYSKYSWAIDQADIALLSDCYTADAAGGFTPIGALQGRHAIVGQLKSFRRHWPWMQHFADVVRLDLEGDGRHARMIVARVIPERPVDASGKALYGAHYQIRARQEDDGQWRICWSDYRPGWFTTEDLPAFDIGVVQPQQKD